jgi:hypothetical protein
MLALVRMPRLLLGTTVLVLVALSESAFAVTIDWVGVGDPGNPPWCECVFGGWTAGAVAYPYQISKYEVTNSEYAEFLNAKAAADPLGLYNAGMASGYGGITRSGSPGSYTYTAIAGRENMPVNFVSYYDALRFANWLNNGQGSGDTETGAYTLLGGTPIPSNGTTVERNGGAAIFLPSEDEWFKAGHYRRVGGATSANPFWNDYPFAGQQFGGNVALPPTCEGPPGASSTSANCGGVGDLTSVGSYSMSPSAHATFDQGGNVAEWSDFNAYFGTRSAVHGGSYKGGYLGVDQHYVDRDQEFDYVGFRVASPSPPPTPVPIGDVAAPVVAGLLLVTSLLSLTRKHPV